jgi:inosine-uridine nucleoside N-ribohydrolase
MSVAADRTGPTAPCTPTPIILDVDPGHDDALAILLAIASPAIDLRLISVVAGNQTLEKTVQNALAVASAAGAHDVPVAAGMDRPLVRAPIVSPNIHGQTGLDGPARPAITVRPNPRHAVDLIIETVRAVHTGITLVSTGPLTNIAMAIRLAPSILAHVDRIVLMGGAVAYGNTTPAAEFNIFADPEAAHVVFSSGVPITMVGLDVTHQTQAVPERRARIDTGTPMAAFVGDLIDFFGAQYRAVYGFEGPPLHDPCAVAQVIQPGIVRTQPMAVEIDLSRGPSYGRTVCDRLGVLQRQPNVDVGIGIDVDAFWDLLIEAIAGYGDRAIPIA